MQKLLIVIPAVFALICIKSVNIGHSLTAANFSLNNSDKNSVGFSMRGDKYSVQYTDILLPELVETQTLGQNNMAHTYFNEFHRIQPFEEPAESRIQQSTVWKTEPIIEQLDEQPVEQPKGGILLPVARLKIRDIEYLMKKTIHQEHFVHSIRNSATRDDLCR